MRYHNLWKFRNSHRRCSVKKGVFRNFAKFIGKHLRQRLFFNKVAGLRPATLLKKNLWHRCFPVSFCEISKNTFFTDHLRTTASESFLNAFKAFLKSLDQRQIRVKRYSSLFSTIVTWNTRRSCGCCWQSHHY